MYPGPKSSVVTELFKRVVFSNQQQPNAAFDLIDLKELHNKDFDNHSQFQLHQVNFYLIILIEEGQGIHTIDFTEHAYKKGSLITVRKDQVHKFHENTSVTGKLLLFTDDFLISDYAKVVTAKSQQLFNEIIGPPILNLPASDFSEAVDLIERIRREYMNRNDAYSLSIIRSELHILITKLFRFKANNSDATFGRKYLVEFIAFQELVERHANETTKVSDYARMMRISTKTLSTITKAIVQKPPKVFIDEICTKQAKRLLVNTELSVKEIAYASGFEEPSNFYKYFKRQLSITPEQFRGQYRQ